MVPKRWMVSLRTWYGNKLELTVEDAPSEFSAMKQARERAEREGFVRAEPEYALRIGSPVDGAA